MKLAMIGMGKLGLPVAVALGQKHEVVGFDVNLDLMRKRIYEHRELGPDLKNDFQDYFDKANLTFAPTVQQAIEGAEIIFVAVQTPHSPMYEGITRLPESREDFNYTYLVSAIRSIAQYVKPEQVVAVISTVLPGTMRREVLPIIGEKCKFCYHPLFIAMGTVLKNFAEPEFVLLGSDDDLAFLKMEYLYGTFYGTYDGEYNIPIGEMSIESAELCKVAYNTFLTMKLSFINTVQEICHKIPGCNVDDISDTLALAHDRLLSDKYLRGGCADSGPCHPRDNIALSWLARKLRMKYDLFGDLMKTREKQTEWLAEIIGHESEYNALPIIILGKAYKADTSIATGSAALLLMELLKERKFRFHAYDPFVDHESLDMIRAVYFIATKHSCFKDWKFPAGSVVIDPWRYIPEQEGVKLIPLGVGK